MEASASTALLQDAVTTMLFYYRMTPNTTTHRTPFELMDSNKVVTRMSLLRPSVQRSNENLQQNRIQRDSVNSRSLRQFDIGDKVLVFNKLMKINDMGQIVKVVGKNCYQVEINGKMKLVSTDDLQAYKNGVDSKMDIVSSSSENENVIKDNHDKLQSFSGSDISDVSEYSDSDDDTHRVSRIKKNYVIPQRRRTKKTHQRSEADKLKDGLSDKEIVQSRTRSGLGHH